MSDEAFTYLWYDSNNKKYYLGKHKGTVDDGYTHSSTVWERFDADEKPEGVRRRILAYGTDPEMCMLEHELLKNRKARCWSRYYNNSVGDPRYVDQKGPNNHFYGKTHTEKTKEKIRNSNHHQNLKGVPKNNKENYQWSMKMTDEERIEHFGRPMEKNGNWKGGIFNKNTPLEEKRKYHREWYAKNRKKINEKRRFAYNLKKVIKKG